VKEVIKFESNLAKAGSKLALVCYGSDYQ
jgi:hypothetical protein